MRGFGWLRWLGCHCGESPAVFVSGRVLPQPHVPARNVKPRIADEIQQGSAAALSPTLGKATAPQRPLFFAHPAYLHPIFTLNPALAAFSLQVPNPVLLCLCQSSPLRRCGISDQTQKVPFPAHTPASLYTRSTISFSAALQVPMSFNVLILFAQHEKLAISRGDFIARHGKDRR